jgi:hypothetical protein
MENLFDLDELTNDELLALSESILERLSAADLKRICDLAEEKRKENSKMQKTKSLRK